MKTITFEELKAWMRENPSLAFFAFYVDRLERRAPHVRSGEVEEVLALTGDAFAGVHLVHRQLQAVSRLDPEKRHVGRHGGGQRDLDRIRARRAGLGGRRRDDERAALGLGLQAGREHGGQDHQDGDHARDIEVPALQVLVEPSPGFDDHLASLSEGTR